jgi:hypothetical protein
VANGKTSGQMLPPPRFNTAKKFGHTPLYGSDNFDWRDLRGLGKLLA